MEWFIPRGRQDFESEGALFSDDVIMTSLLLDFNPKKWGGASAPTPLPPAAYPPEWRRSWWVNEIFAPEVVLFSDDVIMTSLLLDFNS